MTRLFVAVIALHAVALAPAAGLACSGQVGDTIYEDTFQDDSGGWELTPPVAVIKPPNFLISLNANSLIVNSQVLTFRAKEADYCLEGTLPKALAPDNNFYLGLEFWATDYRNYWLAQLQSDGGVSLWTMSNGAWTNIFRAPPSPGFKQEAPNSLRVTTIGGKIAVFLNDQPVKTVRAQIPQSDLRFGIYGSLDKPTDGVSPITVTSYKVTSGH
jgi:hypothetical protein